MGVAATLRSGRHCQIGKAQPQVSFNHGFERLVVVAGRSQNQQLLIHGELIELFGRVVFSLSQSLSRDGADVLAIFVGDSLSQCIDQIIDVLGLETLLRQRVAYLFSLTDEICSCLRLKLVNLRTHDVDAATMTWGPSVADVLLAYQLDGAKAFVELAK